MPDDERSQRDMAESYVLEVKTNKKMEMIYECQSDDIFCCNVPNFYDFWFKSQCGFFASPDIYCNMTFAADAGGAGFCLAGAGPTPLPVK